MPKLGWFLLLTWGLGAVVLPATSHCYKQRSNCFVVHDAQAEDIRMYTKRDRFVQVAQKHGLSKERIEAMIKKGEGRRGDEPIDVRDERGYYGGVYWPHPLYAYPPHYHPPHRPDRPDHRPPPARPPKGPVTIQPTQNPLFNRPDRPRPPAVRPPARPSAPAMRPRPRPVRRAR